MREPDESTQGAGGFAGTEGRRSRGRRDRVRGVAAALAVLALLLLLPRDAASFRWPWRVNHPWPKSSDTPVTPLGHPRIEDRFDGADPGAPYRFAVFGDQRSLADGEWQEMIARIVALDRDEGEIGFLVDTGDIVRDGTHADQFDFLKRILEPARELPYLVALGNHEVHNMESREARENAALFLADLDPQISSERFYYRKDIGPATFLFLDTNPFVYGPDGARKTCPEALDPESAAAAQMGWLRDQLEDAAVADRVLIVTMHHPLVQSSEKHVTAAASLWNCVWEGTTLPELLADGGVDLVLVGHTHTYERFRLDREDGRGFDLVNFSGRPRDAFLWWGSGGRRARDVQGREREVLAEHGWTGLEAWRIRQVELAPEDEAANQFGVFTVGPDEAVSMVVHFLDDDEPHGTRALDPVSLR